MRLYGRGNSFISLTPEQEWNPGDSLFILVYSRVNKGKTKQEQEGKTLDWTTDLSLTSTTRFPDFIAFPCIGLIQL